MNGTIDIETRLDRVESRAAIAELGSAYCIACDDRDMDRLADLFTADVRIRSRDGMMDAVGRDATVAMFDRMFKVRGPAFHWTHDRFVTFDDADADRATGQVLAHAETTPDGVPSIAAIRYEDVYRREDGRWRFAARELSFLYYLPMAEFVGRFPTRTRLGPADAPRAADFPESLPTWAGRHLIQS